MYFSLRTRYRGDSGMNRYESSRVLYIRVYMCIGARGEGVEADND